MSKRANEEEISSKKTKSSRRKGLSNEAKTKIVNKTIEQIKEVFKDPVKNKGYTDSFGDTIKGIFHPILDKFKDLSTKIALGLWPELKPQSED